MSFAAGLLVLALLGQPQPRTYTWRDSAGQTHITNTPPPADAVVLEPPPPPAVEPGQAVRPEPLRASGRTGRKAANLSPAQQRAWEAVDQHLARARAAGDRRTPEALMDSLIYDCLWGNGLWAMPALPVLSLLLAGLLGWWLALGLRPPVRLPLVGGFLLLGTAFGHLLLSTFLYHPQAARLRQNLELLEQHLGTGAPLSPERRVELQQHYQALERASEPTQAPWRFPAEVRALRECMRQVVVGP